MRSTTTRISRSAPGASASPTELGDDLPVTWRHRSERYGEKLATPDTSVGDLIGDIDPVKVAEGRTLGDPETIHFGLVPRTNRGIFCLNELPDLAERIQVALLNVLEERDIGVRGYALRLPLDLVLVASANPEDYTNRGRIITPLKDRFGAEIRTHYPLTLDDELALTTQEAAGRLGRRDPGADLPEHLVEVIARFTRLVRSSPAVDSRSGSRPVRHRGGRGSAASAVGRRSRRRRGGPPRRAHRGGSAGGPDLRPAADRGQPARQGGVRGQRGGPGNRGAGAPAPAGHRGHVPGPAGQRRPGRLLATFEKGGSVETGELVPAATLLNRIGEVPGLAKIMDRLGMDGGESFGEAAAALEFAMEGLYLMRRLSKDVIDGSRSTGHRRQRRLPHGAGGTQGRRSGRLPVRRVPGGPDPLAPPFDARGALDELGDAVLDGPTPPPPCATCCAGAGGPAWPG